MNTCNQYLKDLYMGTSKIIAQLDKCIHHFLSLTYEKSLGLF